MAAGVGERDLLYRMNPQKIPVVPLHIAGWILFQCVPIVFIHSFSRATDVLALITSFEYWYFSLYFIALFYMHSYVLLPYLLAKGKPFVYAGTMVLLLASVIYLQPFEQLIRKAQPQRGFNAGMPARTPGAEMGPRPDDRGGPPPANEFRPRNENGMQGPGGGFERNQGRRRGPLVDIISIFLFIITLCLSAAIDIARRWRLSEQRIAQAEADKANAELSFLKAQINPHFLFNTLNNIYSMVMTNNEHTAESIMKLSNILRHVTDDSKEDFVPLQSEVDCISDYIDLQRLRLGKKVSLEYTVTGNLENHKIAPMILMTFIENVFKYGTSNHEEASLIIRIDVKNDGIHFFSQNKLFSVSHKLERTGIGIDNTEKRLAHVYPGRHKLSIRREDGLFLVDLYLQD